MKRLTMLPVYSAICAGILFLLCSTSCSRVMGYSVLLWSIPEKELAGGTVVPVYIRSNISQVYVIAKPDSKEKFEIPLWQITEPVSKKKALESAAGYSEYARIYAQVKLDGLPIRFEPVNTARQVYRLRKDEIIKVLYKGEGAEVRSGSSRMEGDWFRVLTGDGTAGWCFSYNLRLYDEQQTEVAVEKKEETDPVLEKVLAGTWYPENYKSMIRYDRIDLSQMDISYGFNFGDVSKQVQMTVPGLSRSYPYEGITRTGASVYKLTDTPFTVTVRGTDFIVVQYVDEKGMPKTYNFVSLTEDIPALISKEQTRRQQLFQALQSFGPDFSSSNYGLLQFPDENKFVWSGYQLLVPDVIPARSQGNGTVEFKYFLDKSLEVIFDGILTFRFAGSDTEVNFFYKIEEDHQNSRSGLRLENAAGATFRGTTATARSANSLVLFFECTYKDL